MNFSLRHDKNTGYKIWYLGGKMIIFYGSKVRSKKIGETKEECHCDHCNNTSIIKENGHFLGIEGDLHYFYPSFSNINKAIFIMFGL